MLQLDMAIRFAAEPAKPTRAKTASVAPKATDAGISISKKRPKTGGRKASDDPTVVVTLRLKRSVAERLPPDWRARVAAFLAQDA